MYARRDGIFRWILLKYSCFPPVLLSFPSTNKWSLRIRHHYKHSSGINLLLRAACKDVFFLHNATKKRKKGKRKTLSER
jgi:hypothetical protein